MLLQKRYYYILLANIKTLLRLFSATHLEIHRLVGRCLDAANVAQLVLPLDDLLDLLLYPVGGFSQLLDPVIILKREQTQD